MSSIQLKKSNSRGKNSIFVFEGKGVKNDLCIFRKVAQSKGNCLPFTELKSMTGSNSIYQTLDRLSPRVEDTPGKYLFCYEDLAKDHETDEAREKELNKLVRKLEGLYNHFLQWRNWKRLKPVIKPKGNGNKDITIQFDKNNSIILKLIPRAKKDGDKAVLNFRKRFEPTEDITKYTGTNSLFVWFAFMGRNNNHLSSFKIRKQYVTFHIPLIPKPKGGKLYFRTLSEESYSNIYSRRYLDRVQTEGGQNLRINIKGLLLYALNESDYKELSKSLENLAESDVYQEVKETADTYNELGQTTDSPIYFNYKIKRDFPFLAYSNDLKQILSPNFAAEVIKRIATRLKDRIGILPVEYLRYITTKFFVKDITGGIQNSNLNNNVFQAFRSEITAYLAHLEQRASIHEKNLKILSDIEDRRGLFMERLETTIKNSEETTNDEVIPIHGLITESRLSWFDVSDVLKLIAKKHEKRYTVTDRCLMPKSKTKELKSLLKNEPKYDDSCLSLVNNGVPRQCISEDLLDKLGFQSAFRKSDSTSFIKRKEAVQSSTIHIFHDDSKKVTDIIQKSNRNQTV